MKTLLIVRHAKSSWDQNVDSDFDRPLNDRGRRDAPTMAQRLVKTGIKIDAFVSSPAKRARQTAELFIHEFDRKAKEIRFIPELYHASPETLRDVVTALDDKDGSVAVFSHNPGITSFVNSLTSVRLDNMPTCAIFAVTIPISHWKEFMTVPAEFKFFDYPKSGSD